MMFLTEVKTSNVIKKQYVSKLKAYTNVATSLVIMQILGLLFANAPSQSSWGGDTISFSVNYYSINTISIFTMLWAFMTAITLTTKAFKNDHYGFVANRVTSHVSNGYFLITACLVAALTAELSFLFLKLVVYFRFNSDIMLVGSVGIQTFIIGILALFLYSLLAAVLGYLVGVLIQLSKLFLAAIPVLYIGLILAGGNTVLSHILISPLYFLIKEQSLGMFCLKASLCIALIFACSMLISHRAEVRK